MTGTLYLVSTPIGNLEDITVRALRVLRDVTLIAAEDTRRTAKLLHHYQIGTPTTSFHAHNERGKAAALLARLDAGESIAVVSDAGTPVLSDPGEDLVRQAVGRGIRVEALPGASAILVAIATSGMGSEGFTFAGFPPNRSKARKTWLSALAAHTRPLVLFEAPHRLIGSLSDALDELGDRPMVAARELTKIHEEQVRGTISSVRGHFQAHPPRGEFTLVIGPAPDVAVDARGPGWAEIDAGEEGTAPLVAAGDAAEPLPLVIAPRAAWLEFCRLTNSGVARRAAINELARSSGKSSREIYSLIERGKRAASNAEAEAEAEADADADAEQNAQNGPAEDAPTPSPEKQTRRTPITD
jgi:16S rRNA (cytidine1402-2'-O)-methyltransferase